MNNAEINLKDLLKKILQQWRLLLIAMLVCAIAFTVVGGFVSLHKAHEAEKALAEQIANGGPKEGEEKIVVPKVVFVSVANIAFGLLVGVVLIVVYVTVMYATTSKLRCAADVECGHAVSVIGVIKLDREKKRFDFVDSAIDAFFSEEKNVPKGTNIKIISTDIAASMQKNGIQTVFFTGNAERKTLQPVIKALKSSDKESQLTISFEELAIYSPEALKVMLKSGGVVLCETIQKSKVADISKELEYCKRYDIPVLGCIVIE